MLQIDMICEILIRVDKWRGFFHGTQIGHHVYLYFYEEIMAYSVST